MTNKEYKELTLAAYNEGNTNKIVELNIPLIKHVSQRFYKYGEERGFYPEEIESFAAEGLLQCVKTWKPETGVFYNYAVTAMRNEIYNQMKARSTTLYGKSTQADYMSDYDLDSRYTDYRDAIPDVLNLIDLKQKMTVLASLLEKEKSPTKVRALTLLFTGSSMPEVLKEVNIPRMTLDWYIKDIKTKVKELNL